LLNKRQYLASLGSDKGGVHAFKFLRNHQANISLDTRIFRVKIPVAPFEFVQMGQLSFYFASWISYRSRKALALFFVIASSDVPNLQLAAGTAALPGNP